MPTHRPGDDFAHALITEHRPFLHVYVRNLMRGDQSRVDDVVQETIARAWQHRGRIPAGAVRPWLFRVARNQVVDLWRRRPPLPVESFEAQTYDTADTHQEDAFERVLQDHDTVALLRGLSRNHQEVLVHLYCLDHSQTQTARALGLAEGTVKSRAHYAIGRLRSQREPASSGLNGRAARIHSQSSPR
ncbi:sigma-70 family RNA polymerase sigma factor [Kineosporia succinea]|uniref:RNA polymerase sigma factor n=1 Tax=Kineosporia succinea TaxID=84632 RepID=A0ABT9PE29_9ACTN|nr:sigma-70 family RNA polymerase sigma factor [Kineosporia succinea]MDP9830959.1 RNA polymerase sigma-70 factor (ECF subfamily) [Kineosporia succinea]